MGGAAAWAIVAVHSTSKTDKQTIRVRMSGLLRSNSICQVSFLGSQFGEPCFPDGSGVLREKIHNRTANGARMRQVPGRVHTPDSYSRSRARKHAPAQEPCPAQRPLAHFRPSGKRLC